MNTAFPGTIFATTTLLPPFYEGGYFDKVFSGDISALSEAEFFKHANTLLLIKPQVQFKDSSAISGMRSCSITLIFCAYRNEHAPSKDGDIHVAGIGSSEETSLRNALEKLGEQGKFKQLLDSQ